MAERDEELTVIRQRNDNRARAKFRDPRIVAARAELVRPYVDY